MVEVKTHGKRIAGQERVKPGISETQKTRTEQLKKLGTITHYLDLFHH